MRVLKLSRAQLKKFSLKCKRYLVLVIALILLINLNNPIVASADTHTFNYEDFVDYTDVDGDKEVCYITWPIQYNAWTIKSTEFDEGSVQHGSDDYIGFQTTYINTLDEPGHFYLLYRPIGDSWFRLDNIPGGTILHWDYIFDVEIESAIACDTECYLNLRYYDKNGSFISSQRIQAGYEDRSDDYWEDIGDIDTGLLATKGRLHIDLTQEIVKPDGAMYCKPYFYIRFQTVLAGDQFYEQGFTFYYFTLNSDSYMSLNIDSDYRAAQAQGKTNELLGDIKVQNDTLINGTPQQNEQVSGAVGEMSGAGDKLGDLTDQMEIEKPDTSDMDVSMDALVNPSAIMAYTTPILAFWQNDNLLGMIMIVLTLCLVSWVFFGKKG